MPWQRGHTCRWLESHTNWKTVIKTPGSWPQHSPRKPEWPKSCKVGMSVTSRFLKKRNLSIKSHFYNRSNITLCNCPQLSKPGCFQRKGSDGGRSGNFKIDRHQTGTGLNRMRKCQSACLLVVIIEKGVALLHWFTADTSKSALVTSSLAGHQLPCEFMASRLMFHISCRPSDRSKFIVPSLVVWCQ